MPRHGRHRHRQDSGRGGEWFATGLAPQKADLVPYPKPDGAGFGASLVGLGPHRTGKGCLYHKRLDGIDIAVLDRTIRSALDDLARRWTVAPEQTIVMRRVGAPRGGRGTGPGRQLDKAGRL